MLLQSFGGSNSFPIDEKTGIVPSLVGNNVSRYTKKRDREVQSPTVSVVTPSNALTKSAISIISLSGSESYKVSFKIAFDVTISTTDIDIFYNPSGSQSVNWNFNNLTINILSGSSSVTFPNLGISNLPNNPYFIFEILFSENKISALVKGSETGYLSQSADLDDSGFLFDSFTSNFVISNFFLSNQFLNVWDIKGERKTTLNYNTEFFFPCEEEFGKVIIDVSGNAQTLINNSQGGQYRTLNTKKQYSRNNTIGYSSPRPILSQNSLTFSNVVNSTHSISVTQNEYNFSGLLYEVTFRAKTAINSQTEIQVYVNNLPILAPILEVTENNVTYKAKIQNYDGTGIDELNFRVLSTNLSDTVTIENIEIRALSKIPKLPNQLAEYEGEVSYDGKYEQRNIKNLNGSVPFKSEIDNTSLSNRLKTVTLYVKTNIVDVVNRAIIGFSPNNYITINSQNLTIVANNNAQSASVSSDVINYTNCGTEFQLVINIVYNVNNTTFNIAANILEEPNTIGPIKYEDQLTIPFDWGQNVVRVIGGAQLTPSGISFFHDGSIWGLIATTTNKEVINYANISEPSGSVIQNSTSLIENNTRNNFRKSSIQNPINETSDFGFYQEKYGYYQGFIVNIEDFSGLSGSVIKGLELSTLNNQPIQLTFDNYYRITRNTAGVDIGFKLLTNTIDYVLQWGSLYEYQIDFVTIGSGTDQVDVQVGTTSSNEQFTFPSDTNSITFSSQIPAFSATEGHGITVNFGSNAEIIVIKKISITQRFGSQYLIDKNTNEYSYLPNFSSRNKIKDDKFLLNPKNDFKLSEVGISNTSKPSIFNKKIFSRYKNLSRNYKELRNFLNSTSTYTIRVTDPTNSIYNNLDLYIPDILSIELFGSFNGSSTGTVIVPSDGVTPNESPGFKIVKNTTGEYVFTVIDSSGIAMKYELETTIPNSLENSFIKLEIRVIPSKMSVFIDDNLIGETEPTLDTTPYLETTSISTGSKNFFFYRYRINTTKESDIVRYDFLESFGDFSLQTFKPTIDPMFTPTRTGGISPDIPELTSDFSANQYTICDHVFDSSYQNGLIQVGNFFEVIQNNENDKRTNLYISNNPNYSVTYTSKGIEVQNITGFNTFSLVFYLKSQNTEIDKTIVNRFFDYASFSVTASLDDVQSVNHSIEFVPDSTDTFSASSGISSDSGIIQLDHSYTKFINREPIGQVNGDQYFVLSANISGTKTFVIRSFNIKILNPVFSKNNELYDALSFPIEKPNFSQLLGEKGDFEFYLRESKINKRPKIENNEYLTVPRQTVLINGYLYVSFHIVLNSITPGGTPIFKDTTIPNRGLFIEESKIVYRESNTDGSIFIPYGFNDTNDLKLEIWIGSNFKPSYYIIKDYENERFLDGYLSVTRNLIQDEFSLDRIGELGEFFIYDVLIGNTENIKQLPSDYDLAYLGLENGGRTIYNATGNFGHATKSSFSGNLFFELDSNEDIAQKVGYTNRRDIKNYDNFDITNNGLSVIFTDSVFGGVPLAQKSVENRVYFEKNSQRVEVTSSGQEMGIAVTNPAFYNIPSATIAQTFEIEIEYISNVDLEFSFGNPANTIIIPASNHPTYFRGSVDLTSLANSWNLRSSDGTSTNLGDFYEFTFIRINDIWNIPANINQPNVDIAGNSVENILEFEKERRLQSKSRKTTLTI